MKAVIPAAGLGTRFLPITKAVPKEMLPLGARPVIAYVVEEAAAAGCEEVVLVIAPGKEILLRYFERDEKLERHLERTGQIALRDAVRGTACGVTVRHCYQREMRGLGDAVLCAAPLVENEPFAVLLGDTVYQGPSPLPALRSAWETCGKGAVALEPCPRERVARYGIAGGREIEPGLFELEQVVEKPAPEAAPLLHSAAGQPLGWHAFAARYIFPPEILDCLHETPPGRSGEIQLTDAMELLRQRSGLLGVLADGRRLDLGTPRGLAEAMPHFL